jgi:hypothetical protein
MFTRVKENGRDRTLLMLNLSDEGLKVPVRKGHGFILSNFWKTTKHSEISGSRSDEYEGE